jgi:trehalose 6-phosphate phosphatase
MNHSPTLDRILQFRSQAGAVRLVLDYDGTLVPIARTPDEARPDSALLELLTALGRNPGLDVTVLSGRSLSNLCALLPVPGLTLAGTYGAQVRWASGETVTRADPALVRPLIERVRDLWSVLVAGEEGFLLEDKGLGMALHARFARPASVVSILPAAESAARRVIDPAQLHIVGGDRFLEVAPLTADKGRAVEWLIQQRAAPHELIVYFGDDDKDAAAFVVVREWGGIPIIVGPREAETRALVRLPGPPAVREWLYAIEAAPIRAHNAHAQKLESKL